MKIQIGGIRKGLEVHALWYDPKLKRVTRGGYPHPIILDSDMDNVEEAKFRVRYYFKHSEWEYLEKCSAND